MFTNPIEKKKSKKNFESKVLDAAYEVKGDIRDAAHDAGEKVRHIYENANHDIRQMRDNLTSRINEKPVQSAGVALVAGLVLGAILRRI